MNEAKEIIKSIETHLERVKGKPIEPLIKAIYKLWLLGLKDKGGKE